MLTKTKVKYLEKQGYRIVGNHSSVKVCLWTKKALRNEDTCYKHKFYGIKSWRCIQMTPSFCCNHRCVWCWRDIEFTPTKWVFPVDDPKTIVDGCIEEQTKYLQGFRGNSRTDHKRFTDAQLPQHVAISLSGEPTFYPKLPELVKEIHSRKMTSFLVTNGTNPNMLKKLLNKNIHPTQIYITLPAPNEKVYHKACAPLISDGWQRILKSLRLINNFNRSTIRLTLVKDLNMVEPENYAKLIEIAKPEFVEVKAYMFVGESQNRLKIENMPRHHEIMEFSEEIIKNCNYKIKDEKKESRVVLLTQS